MQSDNFTPVFLVDNSLPPLHPTPYTLHPVPKNKSFYKYEMHPWYLLDRHLTIYSKNYWDICGDITEDNKNDLLTIMDLEAIGQKIGIRSVKKQAQGLTGKN